MKSPQENGEEKRWRPWAKPVFFFYFSVWRVFLPSPSTEKSALWYICHRQKTAHKSSIDFLGKRRGPAATGRQGKKMENKNKNKRQSAGVMCRLTRQVVVHKSDSSCLPSSFFLSFSSSFFLLVSRIFSALFLFPFFCRHSMFHSRPRQLWRLYICVGTKEKTLGNKTTGELVPQCLTDVAASRCETIHRAQQRTTPTFFPLQMSCPTVQANNSILRWWRIHSFFLKIRIQFSFCREFSHRYRQQSKGDLASWRKMFCLCLVGRLECCRSETIIRNGAIKNVAEDYPRTGHLKQCVNRTKVIWSFLFLSLSLPALKENQWTK